MKAVFEFPEGFSLEKIESFGKLLDIKLIEVIDDNQYEIPESHKLILKERMEIYKNNPDILIPIDEVEESIKKEYGL